MTSSDPHALFQTLTDELTEAGWTREVDPASLPDVTGATFRLPTCPDRAARIHAAVYRYSRELVTTMRGPDTRAGRRARDWHVESAALPAATLTAAALAAAEPPGPSAESRLLAAGWQMTGQEYEGSRLLETTWTSPDGTRSASRFPGEGWLINRPDLYSAHAQIDTCGATPGAVTAALALVD